MLAWTAFLSTSLYMLVHAGIGPLGAPPVLHPASVDAWFRQYVQNGPSPAVGAGLAVFRLAAVAVGGYLFTLTLVSLAAQLAGWTRAARLLQRCGPRLVSAVVRGALGLGASTVSLSATHIAGVPEVAAAPVGGSPGRVGAPPATRATAPAAGATTRTTNGPVLEWVRSPGRASTPPASTSAPQRLATPPTAPTTPGPPAPTSATAAVAPSSAIASFGSPQATPTAWTVRPGDSFWSEAEAVLLKAWGRPPTDAEIGPYWLTLIAANASRLLHPEVPDLIYAGQVFVIPAPPPTGEG